MHKNTMKGIYFAVATSFISGVSLFLNKFAVEAVKPPLLLTTSKNVLVGVALVSMIILLKKHTKIGALSRNDLAKLLAIAVIGGSVPFYLFFTGLASIPAINGAIIHKSLVLWVAILAVPFLREKISWLSLTAVILLFIGNIYIGGFTGFKVSQGELMIVVATIMWAVETIIAKKILHHVDPDVVAAFRMGLGSIILAGVMIVIQPTVLNQIASWNMTQFFWVMVTSVLLLGYVATWYRALAYAPATVVTSVLVFATVITNVLSALFVTHTWSTAMLVQSLLICGGIMFAYLALKRASSAVASDDALHREHQASI